MLVSHQAQEVHHATGVPPLVVVPAEDLDEDAVGDKGALGIEDAACGVVHDVGGHYGVLRVLEDALEMVLGHVPKEPVDGELPEAIERKEGGGK